MAAHGDPATISHNVVVGAAILGSLVARTLRRGVPRVQPTDALRDEG